MSEIIKRSSSGENHTSILLSKLSQQFDSCRATRQVQKDIHHPFLMVTRRQGTEIYSCGRAAYTTSCRSFCTESQQNSYHCQICMQMGHPASSVPFDTSTLSHLSTRKETNWTCRMHQHHWFSSDCYRYSRLNNVMTHLLFPFELFLVLLHALGRCGVESRVMKSLIPIESHAHVQVVGLTGADLSLFLSTRGCCGPHTEPLRVVKSSSMREASELKGNLSCPLIFGQPRSK